MIIGLPISIGKNALYINDTYVDYLKNAGYDVQILLPGDKTLYDGLLLPGGIDIDPLYYEIDNISSLGVNPKQDQIQRKLLHLYKQSDKPVFGICRGFQLMFLELAPVKDRVFYNQDIKGHKQQDNDTARNIPSHVVYTTAGGRIRTNSMHHQGVQMCNQERLTKRYVRGWTKDDTVEIIKFGSCFAVQWHPEELNHISLLRLAFNG